MHQLPEPLPQVYTAGQPHPAIQPAQVELYGERRVAYVQSMENPQQSVAIDARLLQAPVPYQPRDLTPQPLIDPLAQRLLAGGVGGGALAAGVGYGIGQVVGALAVGFPVLAAFIILALLAAKTGSRGGTQINQTVHNHVRFGRSTTTVQGA